MQILNIPFKPLLLHLEYTMKGIKQCESQQQRGVREIQAITPNSLRRLKAVWEPSTSDLDVGMLWAAFFGILLEGEMTVPSDDSYYAAVHLSLGDIAVDSLASPEVPPFPYNRVYTSLISYDSTLWVMPLMRSHNCFVIYPVSHVGPYNN